MVIDTRGHDVPGGGDGWGYKQDMAAFSRSINSIQTVPNLTEAENMVDALELDAVPTNGTGWWVEAEDSLYVYRDSTGFSRVMDETKNSERDTDWEELPLTDNFEAYDPSNDQTTPMYKRTGNTVEISGSLRLTSDAVGEEINGTGSVTMAILPANIIPARDYGAYGVHQGSGDAIWLTQYDRGDNELRAARYRNTSETPPTTSSWMPFSVVYFVQEA